MRESWSVRGCRVILKQLYRGSFLGSNTGFAEQMFCFTDLGGWFCTSPKRCSTIYQIWTNSQGSWEATHKVIILTFPWLEQLFVQCNNLNVSMTRTTFLFKVIFLTCPWLEQLFVQGDILSVSMARTVFCSRWYS